MKKAAATFFAILATVVGVHAAAITVTNQFGGAYAALNEFGNPIPTGSGTVAIGTFSIDDATIASLGNGADLAGVLDGFTQFSDSLTVNSAVSGYYQGLITGAITDGDGIAGAQLYTVIGAGSTLGASQSLIVYKHEGVAFQPDPNATPNAALNATPGNIVLGEATTVNINGQDRPAIQSIPIIPEPSSALLGLVGLVFVAFRRRR